MLKKITLALLVATSINLAAIAAHADDATVAQCGDQATGQSAPCDPVTAPAPRKPSAAFTAGRVKSLARMRQCAAEWKTAKADEAVKAGGWPHYWSECNKRLKAAAAQ